MPTNKTGSTVTLASWETQQLSAEATALREKNLGTKMNDVTTSVVTWQAEANKNLVEQQKNAEVANKNLASTIDTNYNANNVEAQKQAQDATASAQEFAKANEAIINKGDASIAQAEQSKIDLLWTQNSKEIALLKSQADAEKEYLKVQQEATRLSNEQAIKDAKYNTEILRQQSAWAYNKLGLNVSSGIINESQTIANQWLEKIARIQVDANLQDAQYNYQIKDASIKYTQMINASIDKFSNAIMDIKTSAINRITETQRNLLQNSRDKNKSIEEIKNSLRLELKTAEREHMTDMQTIRDKGIEYATGVANTVTAIYNQGKASINEKILNGSIYTATTSQLIEMAKWANMTLDEVLSLKNSAISQKAGEVASTIMWADFILTGVERNEISDQVKYLMSSWRTLQEATEIAVKRVLANNSEYKNKQALTELKYKADTKTLQDTIKWKTLKTGSGAKVDPTKYTVKTIGTDWTVKMTNNTTGETITAWEWQDWQVQVWSGNPTFWNPSGAIMGTTKVQVPLKANTKIQDNSADPFSAFVSDALSLSN